MESYEKLYKEALERAKKEWSNNLDNAYKNYRERLEIIFPELKESEDEKIRKAVIELVKYAKENCLELLNKPFNAVSMDKMIVWLEKQGEHKTKDRYTFKSIPCLLDMIEPTDRAKSYCQKLIDSLLQEGYTTDAKIVSDCLKQMNGEKVGMAIMGEQESNWSEEDDKIRKHLISLVKNWDKDGIFSKYTSNPEEIKQILAWLEKQGEKKSIWHNEDEEPKRGSLILLIMQSGTPIVDKVKPNYTFSHGERWAYIDDLLEKEGEKPQSKSALEAIKEEEKEFDEKKYAKDWLEKNGGHTYKVEPKFNVDNADKYEPKFHEGDWTVSNLDGKARQISEVHFDEYNSYYVVNGMPVNLEEFDRRHRFWTIKDAKDGDVISDGEIIVIFKHFEEPSYKQHIVAYIGLDTNGNIQITDDTWQLGVDKAHPATKEQRNTLMKAMINVGWQFDFEKKELNNIKPNNLEWIDMETNECHCYSCELFDRKNNKCKNIELCKNPKSTYKGFYIN